ETRIIYRQESDQLGITAQTLGLTGTEQKLLPGLGTGQGLWRIKDRSFVIQHQLHPAELDAFDTTTRMITKSEKSIDADETSPSLSLNRGGEGV
ncbi:MAG: ATP-binding protein, partial [Micrococcaceae bacterium]|nr:ATP-binding protein [Micrococcaceae bacterium]